MKRRRIAMFVLVVATLMVPAAVARAAQPGATCTGVDAVLDGANTYGTVGPDVRGNGLVASWRAAGSFTLDCGVGSPLTGATALFSERMDVKLAADGALTGKGKLVITVGGQMSTTVGKVHGDWSDLSGQAITAHALIGGSGRDWFFEQSAVFDTGLGTLTSLGIIAILIS